MWSLCCRRSSGHAGKKEPEQRLWNQSRQFGGYPTGGFFCAASMGVTHFVAMVG